jgi:type 1 fimbria pilin
MKSSPLTQIFKLCAALAIGCLGLAHAPAWARCTGGSSQATFYLPSFISAKRDTTAGTVLYDSGWSKVANVSISCQGGEAWVMGIPGYPQSTGLPHVYQSGIPGIGFRVDYTNSASSMPTNMDNVDNFASFILDSPTRTIQSLGPYMYSPGGWFRLQLVALGTPIQNGTSNLPSPVGQVIYGGVVANQASFSQTSVNIQTLGCTVGTKNIIVNLPSTPSADFGGAGSKVGPKPFTIDIRCDANVKVSYRIDGTTALTNVLKNTSTAPGSASGVGIQLFKGDASSAILQP